MENVRVDTFERVTAHVIVAVARRRCKMAFLKAVFLHGIKDFQLIVVRIFVDLLKTEGKSLFRFLSEFLYFR